MRVWTVCFCSIAILFSAATILAEEASPPIPADITSSQQSPLEGSPVTAVVVRSWGLGTSELVWQYLNDNWNLFGTTPIWIDHTSLINAPYITLQDLQDVDADVVIVSDPSGGLEQWTASEVAALESYAMEGHNLVGTYLLLQYVGWVDNRLLAPLWGFNPNLDYVSTDAELTTPFVQPSHCLFTDISDPLDLGGFPYVQVPSDLSWDDEDLLGATIVGRGLTGLNVVTDYDAGPYHAFYISFMPEYQSWTDVEALQWLYNAIVCNIPPVGVESESWGTIKARFRE